MQPHEIPERCAIMETMSDESRARLLRASRTYARLRPQWEAARKELAGAIVEERQEGVKIEDITALVPVRQTQVNRILEAAGMTEKRAKREP
jgi:hypothetical protein